MFLKITLFLIGFSLLSCQSLSSLLLEAPQLELTQVRLDSASLNGMNLVAIFNANNPNEADLNIDEIAYEMSIANKPLFSGVSKKVLTLKAKGQSSIELPIAIKFSEAKEAFDQILNKQKNSYTFQGASKVGVFNIPFKKEGQFEIPPLSF